MGDMDLDDIEDLLEAPYKEAPKTLADVLPKVSIPSVLFNFKLKILSKLYFYHTYYFKCLA
jgi:hypothetical protein